MPIAPPSPLAWQLLTLHELSNTLAAAPATALPKPDIALTSRMLRNVKLPLVTAKREPWCSASMVAHSVSSLASVRDAPGRIAMPRSENTAPGWRKRYAFAALTSRIEEASSAAERIGVQPLGVGKAGGSGGGGDGGGTSTESAGGEGGAHPGACTPYFAQVSGQISDTNSTPGGGVNVAPKAAVVSTTKVNGAVHTEASLPTRKATAGTAPTQSIGKPTCAKNMNGSGRSVQSEPAGSRKAWGDGGANGVGANSVARTAASEASRIITRVELTPLPTRHPHLRPNMRKKVQGRI